MRRSWVRMEEVLTRITQDGQFCNLKPNLTESNEAEIQNPLKFRSQAPIWNPEKSRPVPGELHRELEPPRLPSSLNPDPTERQEKS